MRWNYCVVFALTLASCNVMADSCWTLTGMKDKSAYAADDYRIIDDGFSKSVFVLHFNKKVPSIEITIGPGAYGEGQTLMASENVLIYLGNTGGITADVWTVDPDKGTAYMTQSRAGFGQFNKAGMFVGKAVPGC